MRLIGIDYGTKRVGIAISNDTGSVGFPHGVVDNDSSLLGHIATLATNEHVEGFVIGESMDNHGGENAIMARARQFVAALSSKTGLPVFFEPEQMTSMQVRREKEMKGEVDADAAAVILNSYMTRTQGSTDEPEDTLH